MSGIKCVKEVLYIFLCLVRLLLTLIVAIPCWFLCPIFWLLGINRPWQKMTKLFEGLTFNV